MARLPSSRAALAAAAVFVTALVVLLFGTGWNLPGMEGAGPSWVPVAAALSLSLILFLYVRLPRREKPKKMTRGETVNAEFRHEVERFLAEMSRGPRPRHDRKKRSTARRPPPPPPGEEKIPARSPGELIERIAENLEILGGYREDLSALLRLYRLRCDERLSLEEKERTRKEIDRFEKVVALSFLLEDSAAVQEETRRFVAALGESTGAPKGTSGAPEEWTPVDLGPLVEQVIESLPEDRSRSAWIERHLEGVPLILSRPNTLFEAFYHLLDLFVEIAGGRAIHFRGAQRGDDLWIGVGVGPGESPPPFVETDDRISRAADLCREVGGQQTVRSGEIQIPLPLHGPASIFTHRAGEGARGKTS